MNRTRILVVEDELLIRWDLTERLREAGYEIVEAASAAEATEILERDREIRVLFTDIQMPGPMDGLALARHVREQWPLTVIIICSGKFPDDMRGVPSGCELFGKPFDWLKWPGLLNGISRKLAAA